MLLLKKQQNYFRCQQEEEGYRLYYPSGYQDSYGKTERILNQKMSFVLKHPYKTELTVLFDVKKPSYQRLSLIQTNALVIGRDDACQLVYADQFISLFHCRLLKHDRVWEMQDTDSANGIYVNGQRAYSIKLERGDRLDIAGLSLWFMTDHLLCPTPQQTSLVPFEPFLIKQLSPEPVFDQIPQVPERPLLSYLPSLDPGSSVPAEWRLSWIEVFSPLLYPCLMYFSSYRAMSRLFLLAAVLMVLLRLGDHVLKKYRAHLSERIAKQRLQIQDWLMTGFMMVVQEASFPDLATLHQDYQRYQDYLAWPMTDPRFGSVALTSGIGICLFAYQAILVRLEKTDQLAFLIYQLMVYHHPHQLGIVFFLEKDGWLDWQHWVSHAYQNGQFLVSFQQASDQVLLNSLVDRHYILISQRALAHSLKEAVVLYLDVIHQPVEAILDFQAGQWIDLKQGGKKTFFTTETMPQKEWFYTYFQAHLPAFLTLSKQRDFADLFEDGLDIASNWQQNDPLFHLRAPIGFDLDGKVLKLDLHEAYDGPHLLVAGMTGSGKSVWLSQLILSLSVFYAPGCLQYFLIDFKGGGLSWRFEKLPHVAMTLTNLEENQMRRALYALEDELNWREQTLLDMARQTGEAISDLMSLERLNRQGKVKQRLAHLLIIIDEFAELKQLYPEMLKQLIRIARVGRSLGIHLIMATQQPSGVIDGQILANLKSRLLFRVANRQESQEIIGTPQAAALKEAGTFYFASGNQTHVQFGKGPLWKEDRQSMLRVGHCVALDAQDDFQLLISQPEMVRSLEQRLIETMIRLSPQVEPLYARDFPHDPSPLPVSSLSRFALGYIDDFYHRAFPYYEVNFKQGLLIVGEQEEMLENFFSLLPKETLVIGDIQLSHFTSLPIETVKLKDYLESLTSEILVVFYGQAAAFDQQPDLYHWLAHQKMIGYCFIEPTAAFLRMRLLQLCTYQLCFSQGQERYLLERTTSLSLASPLEMFLRQDQIIYKGRLFQATGCSLLSETSQAMLCLGRWHDQPYYTQRCIVLEDEEGIYRAYLASQHTSYRLVWHYPESDHALWIYCVSHHLASFLRQNGMLEEALHLRTEQRTVYLDGTCQLEF